MQASELVSLLTDARRRTLQLQADLSEEQMRVPLLPIINPVIWELGHVAWFQEKWVLRHLRGEPPVLPQGDAWWDSAAVPHDDRWQLPLPSRAATLAYLQEVLDRVLDGLPPADVPEEQAYFYWLAVMHEDMHAEAFTYTRQTLGYAAPCLNGPVMAPPPPVPPVSGDAFIPGGEFLLGASPGPAFVFDNEKWAHLHRVAPFALARTPVTNGQFAGFVEDDGYLRRELWSSEGWEWREKTGAQHPLYWVREGSTWFRQHYDQIVPLGEALPVIHVNFFEAEAWCRWARRRLPTEAEWEMAAAAQPGTPCKRLFPWGEAPAGPEHAFLDARRIGCGPAAALPAGDSAFGCRQMIGSVWEWTASDFLPYPGFVLDPYKEYSAPWFTPAYKVLRGGCWATRSRLIRNTWRNFYTKDRRDVFAGFRTCALSAS
jgi:iron(II)-dependent oxidoreductase